ncbi:MAG: peptide chain release factor N(5)-glutamine methyltransferase [Candidatus Pacebacteria bacterium]|nr:peptide chain release factor N(5)-glutamine methyltransferase [Candidatus Paceibacterota bacterium]
MNLKEAITFAQIKLKEKGITSAPLDAEVLLLAAIDGENKDKSWMYLNLEKYILSPEEEKTFKSFIRRREKNEPAAYITGKKEFYGIDFFVDKNVLIPRVETEIIVDEVLAIVKSAKDNLTLIDIGTGSGCIPISILKTIDASGLSRWIKKVYADDISDNALKVARTNAKLHKVSPLITFLDCDLEIALDKIKKSKNLILTANLPYISPEGYEKLAPNIKSFEPKIALTTKNKGLYHITRLIEKFAALSPHMSSYHIFLEADPMQMKSIESLAKKNLQNTKTEIIRDLRGKKRVAKIYKK